jgi:indole-3-glycerol phosphate synthase
LLIVALLEKPFLKELLAQATAIGLDVLVETHTEQEVMTALEVGASIIGINNRNLKTFATSLSVTETLAPLVGEDIIIVAESGIKTSLDAKRMKNVRASSLLVGETLMRSSSLKDQMQELQFC